MKKSLFGKFNADLQKQVHQVKRQFRRGKEGRERAQRQQEVYNAARSERAARAQAKRLRSAQRGMVQRWLDVQEALRWDTFRQGMQEAGKRSRKTLQAIRKARPQSEAVRRWSFRLALAVAAVSLVANVVLFNRYSTSRPLVTIGHRVVQKREYLASLDAAAGKAVLSKIVFGELITQAAAKAGVTPSEQDIDARLADLRRRTPGSIPAEDTLELRAEVKEALALENLRVQNVTAGDGEIAAYYTAHKSDFTLPPQTQASLVVTGSVADANEAVHLLVQDMPEAAIATHRGLHVAGVDGFQVNMNSLPPAVRGQLTNAVMQMKSGEIKTFTLGKVFLTFKVKNHNAGAVLPLSQVRDQVARQVKLQKAPTEQQQVAALYRANKPYFDMAVYQNFFSDVDNAPAPAKPGGPAKTASLP